ncbi:hypothetical protein N0V93_002462 [Gnomoniopsis smithogilvyi]|uniref:NmrA-like domain-containing protein n=1 Tax=Gnomoniopsis smithogilvyi TaxID=1191159 RepID=A0A9W9CZ64_9PEZI|nr:hypothetical protein N0V93_002462 [Gnomoniopsis smithogilvyi]
MSRPAPFVAVAGAAGKLGALITTNLRARNVSVKALVRPNTSPSRTASLRTAGAVIAEADTNDVHALKAHLRGATVVVSALNGLEDVMLGSQKNLLDAAVAVQVKRFIPSDFSLDFTKTKPGSNRNLDFRREFHAMLDESGIAWTSILNGAFMDMLSGDIPLINERFRRVIYWDRKDQPLDFTTYADTAAYTAAVAADSKPTPKYLRIAGEEVTPEGLAAIASKIKGGKYETMWVGSAGFLEGMAGWMRWLGVGGKETDVFPAWQGMQYTVNMFSGEGKLSPLDNDRYPELKWTKIEEVLSKPVSES